MNDRLSRIRESEKRSHTEIYTNEKLYQSDSWLQRPIKTVQELLPFFDEHTELRALDLGCGVGRNSIYIAQQFKAVDCSVDCVDLLEIAIEKLLENAAERGVSSQINGITQSIEAYKIQRNAYDLIMAISALEHIDFEVSFRKKLAEIRDGIREKGLVCLVINSNVTETCLATNKPLEAQFEVNLPTETIQAFLAEAFSGWEVIKASVVPQQYDIPRESFTSRLNTNVVTYVARKNL